MARYTVDVLLRMQLQEPLCLPDFSLPLNKPRNLKKGALAHSTAPLDWCEVSFHVKATVQ